MLPKRETLLCRYHYDPLDRLVDCTPTVQATTRCFYQKDRLTTEIQGTLQRSIMQHDDQVLAQQSGGLTQLLATDQQRSVLNVLDAARLNPLAYSPYGHRPAENGLLSLLGFNGERADPVTGWYLLGNGYRAFNPVLMRFNSPDSWSPFGEGGLNAYGYCVGDPVNRNDPTGHNSWLNLMRKHFPKAVSNALNLKEKGKPSLTRSIWTTDSAGNEIVLTQANGAAVGPPPRYTAKNSTTPFNGRLARDLHASPPTYDSLYADGMSHTDYPPEFSSNVARVPPQTSRIQARANNLEREYQSILDSIQDTPSPFERHRIRELETLIGQLRADSSAPIGLPAYQKQ